MLPAVDDALFRQFAPPAALGHFDPDGGFFVENGGQILRALNTGRDSPTHSGDEHRIAGARGIANAFTSLQMSWLRLRRTLSCMFDLDFRQAQHQRQSAYHQPAVAHLR
jgi:hypothetical protein